MPIVRLDHSTTALVKELHAVHQAAHDEPGLKRSFDYFTVATLFGWEGGIESYAEVRDGSVVGGYAMALPEYDNTHLANLNYLVVSPGARRLGVGSALLRHALGRTRALGRRLLLVESRSTGPGAGFARARGFTAASTEVRRVLDLRSLDWAGIEEMRAEAVRQAAGYRLESTAGALPESLYPDLALLISGMNDAPTDDLDIEDERWDAERVATTEQTLDRAGQTGYVTLARHAATGEPAGYTRLLLDRDEGDGWVKQTDTVVLRGHRGHRLGLALKLTNLLALRDRQPGVERVVTWNAASNTHMVAINERLGYQPLDEWHEWQLPVG